MQILRDIGTSRAPLMGFIAMGAFWGVWSTFIPQLKTDIGADDAELGHALVFVAVGAIPAMIIGGRLNDRCGPWLLPVSIALFGASAILPAFATTPMSLSVLLLVVGAASGFMDVIMNGRVSALESQSRSPLMQLNHGTFAIVFFAAAALTGILRAGGIAVSTALIGTSVLILGLALPSHTRKTVGGHGRKSDSKARSLSPLVVLFGLIAFTAFLAENGMQQWSALHLERTLNADPSIGGLGPGLLALSVAAGRFAGQGLGRRIGDGTLLTGASLIGVAGAVMMAMASNVTMALTGLMLCGAGISVIAPAGFSLAGRSVPDSRRGSAIATASIIAYTGFFVGPAVLGLVSERFGLPTAFFVIAAIVGTVLPLWLVAKLSGPKTADN